MTSEAVAGWALDKSEPGVPTALDVIVAGRVVDRILANLYRQDLIPSGISSGFHGFVYRNVLGLDVEALTFRPTGHTEALCILSGPCTSALPALEGRIDMNAAGVVSGWAFNPAARSETAILEVLMDGERVAGGPTYVERSDVAEAFECHLTTGFRFVVPVRPGAAVSVGSLGGAQLEGPAFQTSESAASGSFDGLAGSLATGWATDPAAPAGAVVEFHVAGRSVGSTTACLYREDVALSGQGDASSGFCVELDLTACGDPPFEVEARVAGRRLMGSPIRFEEAVLAKRWRCRGRRVHGRLLERLRRWCAHQADRHIISLIMPIYDTPEPWLREAMDSVLAQWSPAWELVCVDDASSAPHVGAVLAEYAARDPRVKTVCLKVNRGIAGAVNAGASAASGTCFAVMDHDDVLEPDAVHWLAQAMRSGAGLAYTDEIVTGSASSAPLQFALAPDFSHDYYLSHPYFVHLICVTREIFDAAGGWDESMSISADVDFVLRAVERSTSVAHVAAPLYRWRTHGGSAGHIRAGAVMEATRGAIGRHLVRIGWPTALVSDGPTFNQFRVDWPDGGGTVLVVIPTRDRGALLRACVETLFATAGEDGLRVVVIDHGSTEPEALAVLAGLAGKAEIMSWEGPFNYSAMNNQAVETHGDGCAHVLLLNNDVEAMSGGWLSRMRSLSGRPGVGAVGATLVYPNGTVQHAGVVTGLNGAADHAHRHQALYGLEGTRAPGHLGSLSSVREWSAVTGACMMVPMTAWRATGGLDEEMRVGFNDVDLCLRLGTMGLKVLTDPFSVLLHRESATRAETGDLRHPADTKLFRSRWSSVLTAGDPFYSPFHTLRGPDHSLASERGPGPVVRVRSTALPQPPAQAQIALVQPSQAARGVRSAASRRSTKGRIQR